MLVKSYYDAHEKFVFVSIILENMRQLYSYSMEEIENEVLRNFSMKNLR